MVSVLIVDDETLVRFGFELILNASPDIDRVFTCESEEALRTVQEHRPDVVLLDIRMPRLNGLEVLEQFRRLDEPPTVAMLTTFDTEEYLGQAIERGAAGFLLKDIAPEALIRAVLVLAGGGAVLAPGIDPRRIMRRPTTPPTGTLTERELQTLRLLAAGMTNQQIADAVGVSVGTVKDDLSSAMAAFEVTTRVQVALAAQQAGLLDG